MSREGHFWTVLHYACHYGHIEVLKFLLNYLEENDLHDQMFEVLNMQTLEGKTPLTCAILSGDINLEKKKQVVSILF